MQERSVIYNSRIPLNDTLPLAERVKAKHSADSLLAQHHVDSVWNARLFTTTLIYRTIRAKSSNSHYTTSIFYDHKLKTSNLILHDKQSNGYKWMSPIILLALLLIVFVKQFNPKKFSGQLTNFFSARLVVKQMRDDISITNVLSLSLLLVYILTASLFIFQLLRFYRIFPKDDLSLLHFGLISLMLVIVYIVKTLILKFAGLIFKAINETDEYLYNVLLFNMILGVSLLPIVVCIAYAKLIPTTFLFNTGFILVLFFFIFRIVKGMQVGWNSPKISKFYLFLYLCILEVLPLVSIMKVISLRF